MTENGRPASVLGIERRQRVADADDALAVGDDRHRPCAMPSVPSVATNGGIPAIATSRPLATPKARPTTSAAASAEQHDRSKSETIARITRGQRQHGAHRQIQPLAHDDERHRQRQQRQDRGLHAELRCWRAIANPGAKMPKMPTSRASIDRDPGDAAQRAGDCGRLRMMHPSRRMFSSLSRSRASSPTIVLSRMT